MCGGNYNNASGFMMSPSYPSPYPQMADCIYLISQPNGTYVNITFPHMDILCEDMYSTSDYIEIRDGNSSDSPVMGIFCGNNSNVPSFIQATKNHVRIR